MTTSDLHVGFTGTRRGMTDEQFGWTMTVLRHLMRLHRVPTLHGHHGDCEGADAEFHELMRHADVDGFVHMHPPIDEEHRAFCDLLEDDVMYPRRKHMQRNKDIVLMSRILIAVPYETDRQEYGGTWRTYGMAESRGLATYLIRPDGSVEKHPGNWTRSQLELLK